MTDMITYRSILRRDGVFIAFFAATIGRLSYAMISLALLLTIQGATHSYAAAGASIRRLRSHQLSHAAQI